MLDQAAPDQNTNVYQKLSQVGTGDITKAKTGRMYILGVILLLHCILKYF